MSHLEVAQEVDLEVYHEISKFYYKEARLFSTGNYRALIDSMVAPDVHYWLPIVEDRYRADPRPQTKFLPAIYDDYHDLDQRIRQLETHLSRRTNPEPRMRHVITNIEAFHAEEDEDEFDTCSNFVVCRNRREHEQVILVGGREDRLRREKGSFKLVRRKILLPQRVIHDSDLFYLI